MQYTYHMYTCINILFKFFENNVLLCSYYKYRCGYYFYSICLSFFLFYTTSSTKPFFMYEIVYVLN